MEVTGHKVVSPPVRGWFQGAPSWPPPGRPRAARQSRSELPLGPVLPGSSEVDDEQHEGHDPDDRPDQLPLLLLKLANPTLHLPARVPLVLPVEFNVPSEPSPIIFVADAQPDGRRGRCRSSQPSFLQGSAVGSMTVLSAAGHLGAESVVAESRSASLHGALMAREREKEQGTMRITEMCFCWSKALRTHRC